MASICQKFQKFAPCSHCGGLGRKHSLSKSSKIGLFGKKVSVVNPRYRCEVCGKYFTVYTERHGKYTRGVYRTIVGMWDYSKTYEENSEVFESSIGVAVPVSTLCDWLNERKKKREGI